MKIINKVLLLIPLLSVSQISEAAWKNYADEKNLITYQELLNYVRPSSNSRRYLCAAFVTVMYKKEKGNVALERGIYGNAWDMHERLKKYNVEIKGKNIKDILEEGDLLFSKHHGKKFQSYSVNHVAIYIGSGKIIHQFTDPDNEKEEPKVEILSIEEFLKKFELKAVSRPFPENKNFK